MRKNTVLFLGLVIFSLGMSHAQESILQSNVVGGQASELNSPSSQIFEQEEEKIEEQELSKLEELKSEISTFIDDTTYKLNMRSMYMDEENFISGPENNNERVSWAAGGSLAVKTGKFANVFDVKAEVFTSQKLYGPSDKDGAGLLEPGQKGFYSLGVVNPRFKNKGHVLSLYRQRHDLPYVNSQDSRMTPNTFESYDYAFIGADKSAPFKFGGGYFDGMKKRNDDEFISLTDAAGIEGRERGMPWFGGTAKPRKEINLAFVNYSLLDTLNIFYGDADFSYKISNLSDVKFSFQYSNQTAIGSALLAKESNSTEMYGSQVALSYNKAVLRSAVTMNSSSSDLISPFGAYPGFNGAIVEDFNRAGEVAWKIGLSYDLAGIDLDGFSAYVDFIQGSNAVDQMKQSLSDKREVDLNIDFHPSRERLSGFWLRLRGGFVDSESAGSTDDFRVILNYNL
jgi:hypothetical protein